MTTPTLFRRGLWRRGTGAHRGSWSLALLLILPLPELQDRATVLASFDLSRENREAFRLPRELEEISGLATTVDGRLFGHHDERAVFFELDPDGEEIHKSFSAGRRGVAGDFEGIAIVGTRFYLSTSSGSILETEEGSDGAAMGYRIHDTGLGRQCEMEGLAFDPGTDTLLLPCKTILLRSLEEHLVVFAVQRSTMTPALVPRVFLPLRELEDFGLDPSFHPSGIEIHPEEGHLLLVSARDEALLELSAQGSLLDARKLRKRDHPQTEGITFGSDGSLLLADEGQGNRGRLTRYRPAFRAPGGPS